MPVISEKPFQIKNYTFLLVVQNITWFEALEYCKSKDMYPASIADAFIQSHLSVKVHRAGTPMWIGFFSEDVGASPPLKRKELAIATVLSNCFFLFRLDCTTDGPTTATLCSVDGSQTPPVEGVCT